MLKDLTLSLPRNPTFSKTVSLAADLRRKTLSVFLLSLGSLNLDHQLIHSDYRWICLHNFRETVAFES
jgi:hypothetical protein